MYTQHNPPHMRHTFAALHLAALKGHDHVVRYLVTKAKYEIERGYDKELIKILNSYKHGARILSWLEKESRHFDVNARDMVRPTGFGLLCECE